MGRSDESSRRSAVPGPGGQAPPPAPADGTFDPATDAQALLRETTEATLFLDLERRIRAWNPAASNIFAYEPDEVLGKPESILLPPESAASGENERLLQTLREKGRVRNVETTRVTKDGVLRRVLLSETLVFDDHGEALGSVVGLRDVTGFRRRHERTEQLERLSLIGQVTSSLIHEIKNPLASLKLNIDDLAVELEPILRSTPGEQRATVRDILDILGRQVEALGDLAEQCLEFARTPKRRRATTDLNVLIRALLRFMRRQVHEAHVELETDLDPALPQIVVDAQRFKQVIFNLVQNALDAMRDVGGRLRVATKREGNDVVFLVEDTGPGIPRGDEERIFEPYFTTKEHGSGLGLAFCREAILRESGTIGVEPVDGGGARFWARLPIVKPEQPPPAPPEPEPGARPGGSERG